MDTTTKTCTKCGETKALLEYRMNANNTGLRLDCKDCERKQNKEHYSRNRQKILDQKKQRRIDDPDKFLRKDRTYRELYPERVAGSTKKWREANPDKVKAAAKRYYEENKYKYNQYDSSRRKAFVRATPSWLTPDQRALIENLYKFRANVSGVVGREYHVDHIVPLQSEIVCGLHVPWNLQVIPAKDNLSKSNSTDHLDTLV